MVESPFSRAVLHKLHGRLPTAAIMASSLACFVMIRGRFPLTRAVGVIFPVSKRRCSNRQNILASG